MSEFQQLAATLAAKQTPSAWLAEVRARGLAQWQQAPWPNRRAEHWQYTSLVGLQKQALTGFAQSAATVDVEFIEIDATRVVFVDGVFSDELSDALPAEVVRFKDANPAQQALLLERLGTIADASRNLFSHLSDAWLDDGLLLQVKAGSVLDKPLYVVHLSTQGQTLAANQRLLVVLEKSAQATVIEHYQTQTGEISGFVNTITELFVGENAALEHYRINLESEQVVHVGGVHTALDINARLNGFTIAEGSVLKRLDYQVMHRGKGADLNLQGIYLPRNKQLVDYHTNVCHMVPNCTSSEVFRGIIADSSRAVFNGRIYIHPQAQKTLAELSNKNLLTSSKAEIDTKPELEIYADDVKCAHGATVSQLNEAALHYLQSRGISHQEATVMLSFGFINELLEQIREPAVRYYLLPKIAALFGRDNELLKQMQND